MTSDEWVNIVRIMRLKWPNMNWGNETVKAAFEDLQNIGTIYVEKAIEQSFKSGAEFPPNPSKIYSSAMEIMRHSYIDEDMPKLEEPGMKLRDYLKMMNYESFTHAMFEAGRKRFLAGKSEVFEDFDYSKEWFEGGKEEYLEKFGLAAKSMSKVFSDEEAK
jgi:hypothetical protein